MTVYMHGRVHVAYAGVVVQNFGTKFLLRRGECKTREIPIWKNGKIVISVKNLKFIL